MAQSNNCPSHVAIELAGFAAAQAVCCVFDRVPFPPMAFARKGPHNVTLTLIPAGTPEQMSGSIRGWLGANVDGADAAVVICDAFITIGGVRKDALVAEGRSYGVPMSDVKVAVPYRAHHHPLGFAICRPKFIVESLKDHDAVAYRQAFFSGVSLHEAGRRVWDACGEESW